MINFDNYVNENKTKHNKSWPYIPDHPYRILRTGGSGSGKTDLLLNLIRNQPDVDVHLINKRENVGMDHINDPKTFIEYSKDMHDVYKNIDEYNPDKENVILIVFDDMISNMIDNKKLIQ